MDFLDNITYYFSNMPREHRSILLIGGLSIFLILEYFRPYVAFSYNKLSHSLKNLFFTACTVIINLGLAWLLLNASDFATENQIGIFHLASPPIGVQILFGLMAMDLIAAWLPHIIQHKIPFLWQFHLIHHTDKEVDTTTANRHHPIESVIRFIFTIIAIFIIGAPIWLIFLYQSCSLMMTQFNHANIKLPKQVDHLLSYIICTPGMHRVHHHYRQPYSDMNYGNIFSCWDRVFQTFVKVDNKQLIFGLDTYFENKEVNNIGKLLALPFKGYRKPITYSKNEKLYPPK